MRAKITRSIAARRWTYRRGQSLVLTALAALVVAACASAPLYERAVEAAAVRTTLGSADVTTRGIEITTDHIVPVASIAPTGSAAGLFARPVSGGDLRGTTRLPGRKAPLITTLAYRDDVCAHLTITAGRCYRGDGEVVASAATARAVGLRVGQRLTLAYTAGQVDEPVTLVGLYRPFASGGDYWWDSRYSTPAGLETTEPTSEDPGGTALSAFFASASEVSSTDARVSIYPGNTPLQGTVVFPLRVAAVGPDDLSTLRSELARLSAPGIARSDEFPRSQAMVQTGLPDLLTAIDQGRRDARRQILALGVQIALLAALCFLVVVLAAADQRRPELALSRLRGNGVRSAAGVFVREIAGLSVLAVIPGVLAAYGLTALACRIWLGHGIAPQITAVTLLGVVAALVVLGLVAAGVGLRTSRQPVADLLREVPPARAARGLGILEAVVFVAALAGLVTTLRGGGTSPLSTLTPTFLAVLAGLVLGRALAVGGRAVGRTALRRARLVTALAATSLARRTGGRLTATVLCVATALVVFAGQQWSVAQTNREQRAAATNGAAVALDVQTPSMPVLLRAVRGVDPQGTWATPLAVAQPPNAGAVPLVAVDPVGFRSVASFGRPSARPDAATFGMLLPGRRAPSLAIRGDTLSVTLASARWSELEPPPAGGPKVSAILQVLLRFSTGSAGYFDLGTIPQTSFTPTTLTAPIRCDSGCAIAGFAIDRVIPDSTPLDISFVVSAIRAGGKSLNPGNPGDWATTTPPGQISGIARQESMTVVPDAAGLRFDAVDDGNGSSIAYLDLPIGLPALVAGPTPDARDPLGYTTASGLDGLDTRVKIVGTVPFAPGIGPSALLVDLDLAVTTSRFVDALTTPAVWLRTDDPARERRLVAALTTAGIGVTSRTSSADLRRSYEDSAPGWSARYSVVVAGLAELLGLGLLVLVLLTSRRTREQDLAALRLSGVAARRLRRATTVELVATVAAGVLGGTVAGVVAAHLVLKRLPIFATPPVVPLPPVFPLEWTWLAGGVVITAVLLVVTAVLLARAVVRRATPDRYAGSAVNT